MADSLSTGLGEEKEKENEDRERDTKAVKTDQNKEKDGITDTPGFHDKNGGDRDRKGNLSEAPDCSSRPKCVADRLFSSFGQDILDALYWTATEPKEKKRAHIGVIPHFLMAVLYVCILTGMDL
ncbi:hypothetical protein GOODEAATRI_001830 [Goodea atripinnis]|uniref:Uncharacterized protein n=1 Tax=Goodea atripinnis TaxID=208336 RepID=A0ABV0N855_9TELE